MFNDEIKNQLRDILKNMKESVYAFYFSDKDDEATLITKDMLNDLAELNSGFKVAFFPLNSDEAKVYNIDKNGGLTLVNEDKKPNGIKFYGPPAGYEINSLIHTILELSGANHVEIDGDIMNKINSIDKKVNIKVFVGLQCPHCPGAVISAHTIARYNDNVEAEMVEATTYKDLSGKFNVSSVPRIIINDGEGDLLGNQPIEEIIKVIETM